MQFVGLAGMVLLLPPVVWAWRLVFGEPSRFTWKTVITWLLATVSAALALALLPVMGTWPLPTGIGGVSGDLLLRLPAMALGAEPKGFTAGLLSFVLAFLVVAFTVHACGLSLRRAAVEASAKIPVVRPSTRVAIKAEEVDFDDDEELDEDIEGSGRGTRRRSAEPHGPRLRVLAHWSLSLAGVRGASLYAAWVPGGQHPPPVRPCLCPLAGTDPRPSRAAHGRARRGSR